MSAIVFLTIIAPGCFLLTNQWKKAVHDLLTILIIFNMATYSKAKENQRHLIAISFNSIPISTQCDQPSWRSLYWVLFVPHIPVQWSPNSPSISPSASQATYFWKHISGTFRWGSFKHGQPLSRILLICFSSEAEYSWSCLLWSSAEPLLSLSQLYKLEIWAWVAREMVTSAGGGWHQSWVA